MGYDIHVGILFVLTVACAFVFRWCARLCIDAEVGLGRSMLAVAAAEIVATGLPCGLAGLAAEDDVWTTVAAAVLRWMVVGAVVTWVTGLDLVAVVGVAFGMAGFGMALSRVIGAGAVLAWFG